MEAYDPGVVPPEEGPRRPLQDAADRLARHREAIEQASETLRSFRQSFQVGPAPVEVLNWRAHLHRAFIRQETEPLFERAEREGLWFRAPGLVLTPQELRAHQAAGRYCVEPTSWQLLTPDQIEVDLDRAYGMAADELHRFYTKRGNVPAWLAGLQPNPHTLLQDLREALRLPPHQDPYAPTVLWAEALEAIARLRGFTEAGKASRRVRRIIRMDDDEAGEASGS